jgi:hypothetical protein
VPVSQPRKQICRDDAADIEVKETICPNFGVAPVLLSMTRAHSSLDVFVNPSGRVNFVGAVVKVFAVVGVARVLVATFTVVNPNTPVRAHALRGVGCERFEIEISNTFVDNNVTLPPARVTAVGFGKEPGAQALPAGLAPLGANGTIATIAAGAIAWQTPGPDWVGPVNANGVAGIGNLAGVDGTVAAHMGAIVWDRGASAATGVGLTYQGQNADVLPLPFIFTPQAPWVNATGANRKGGDVQFVMAAPTNGGVTYPKTSWIFGGVERVRIGYSATLGGSIVLNADGAPVLICGFPGFLGTDAVIYGGTAANAPSATNYSMDLGGATTSLNAQSQVACTIAGVTIQQVWNASGIILFGSALTALGGGIGVVGLQNASTNPTASPVGGGCFYEDAAGGAMYHIGINGDDEMVAGQVVTVTGAAYTIARFEKTLLCNRAGAIAVTLPAAKKARAIKIYDASGGASVNNITITPAAGTINGNATYVLNLNRAGVELTSDGANWFVTGSYNGTVV